MKTPTLDPGCLKLYKTLKGLSRRYGYAFAGQKWLAKHFDVCRQTIAKWIKALISAGLIELRRAYHSSTEYRIVRSLQDYFQHRQLTLTRRGPYSTPSETVPISGERSASTPEQEKDPAGTSGLVRNYFGDTTLAGKQADDHLVLRIGRILRDTSGFERWKYCVQGWLKRSKPDGWGIFVLLAQDAARMRR